MFQQGTAKSTALLKHYYTLLLLCAETLLYYTFIGRVPYQKLKSTALDRCSIIISVNIGGMAPGTPQH